MTGIRSCTSASKSFGGRGEDRAGFKYVSVRVPPAIPKTRECKDRAGFNLEGNRLFLFCRAPPFVKPIGWNQTSLFPKRLAK
jgi:hypothetical protein